MLQYDNGGILVESVSELPEINNPEYLVFDVESTSFDDNVDGLAPYKGHRISGFGIMIPGDKPYYIPMRHRAGRNLPVDAVQKWFAPIFKSAKNIIGHNVKFDAHFAKQEGWDFTGRLVDTMTLAKIIDSDRMRYGLDALTNDWLERKGKQYKDRISQYLKDSKSKDYAVVPSDILGEYCSQDIIDTWMLYQYIDRRTPEECKTVRETEILLTAALFDMETEGICVNPQELDVQDFLYARQLLLMEEEISNLAGFPIRPHTNSDCYELLCNHLGLPVMGYTEKKEPSFEQDVMLRYANMQVDDATKRIINLIRDYRTKHTFHGMFIVPWKELQVNGILHPDFNQAVRTGRMSCRNPNMQQLNKEAKKLIHPAKDCFLFSSDYSQIEFRIIVHYIQNQKAIDAYNLDPNTDFHQLTADMIGIDRKPAKNMNFMFGFGGGERKTIEMLMGVESFVKEIMEKYPDDFERQIRRKARAVYEAYHENLPELKRVSAGAKALCEQRGWVKNFFGRRRHLPREFARKAFNAVVQSSAADVMKERTVALAPRYNRRMRENNISINLLVHDNTVFRCPNKLPREELRWIETELENTPKPFRVPMRTNSVICVNNLADEEEFQWTKS